MSSDGSITLTWADGEHVFRLAIGQLRQLQDKCDAGPQEIYARLMDGTWRVDDIRETLRLGLIGGGADPMKALSLITHYVDERPWIEGRKIAQSVILAALVGVSDDPVGKETGGETATGVSSSPPSTEPGQPSDGRPDRSTN